MAGHSLGEYTALTASGAININECSKLLKLRGKYMQNSYPENESVMLAVIGLSLENIESILNLMENKNATTYQHDYAGVQDLNIAIEFYEKELEFSMFIY